MLYRIATASKETTMTLTDSLPPTGSAARAEALSRIERRVLWLSTAMVHAANTGSRKDPDGLKVGGHQASSASMVSIMTALWFSVLRPQDRVSVTPHASPSTTRPGRSASARPRRSGVRSRAATPPTSRAPSAHAAASTRWWVTPNSMRAQCGRPCSTPVYPSSANSSGSSTSTGSNSTASRRTYRPPGCRLSSRRPDGR